MKAMVTAYAKINLRLDVLAKRPDGYHDVAMIMQAVDLADYLTIAPSTTNRLHCHNQYIPNNMDNLAMQAVTKMQAHFPQVPPLAVTLEKNIPVAAGLAGGSTDCAAVMLGINQLFHLNASEEQLMALAAEIGSDVPFCLTGPTALATGRGEQIQLLPDCPPLWVVLVKPAFGVATASVYQNFKPDPAQHRETIDNHIQALNAKDYAGILKHMANDLERSTFELHPDVQQLKQALQAMGACQTMMSGSGPTILCVFTKEKDADDFYRQAKDRYQQVYLTKTVHTKHIQERVTLDDE